MWIRNGVVVDQVDADNAGKGLPVEQITWSVLLAHWVDFARSAVALPTDEDGNRLRDSVPDLIMLQALWFALQHLDDLDNDEIALGLDRAEYLMTKHVALLRGRWETMPPMMVELIEDLRSRLGSQNDRYRPGFGEAEAEVEGDPQSTDL